MKDRNDTELYPGDWIIISANISTASQALLYGFVTKSTENRINIVREYGTDWYPTKPYIKTYMTNSKAIMQIPRDIIPMKIQLELLKLYNSNGD